jgi:hypothetical protein
MKIQQSRPAGRPSASQSAQKPTEQAPTKQTGWKPATQSPAAQARALSAFLKSPEGAAQASKIVQTVAKKNDLAKALNWEAGHLKAIKPNGDGTFDVGVQLDVLTKNGGIQKNYFSATVNAQGKVLSVPQG